MLLGCCLCAETLDGHVDAHAVLDVVTARVGLNEFFGRWEEMRKTPEFIAAAAAPVLAKPLTRVTAQKLVNRKVGESDGGGEEDATGGLYDHSMASFIDAFEESKVKLSEETLEEIDRVHLERRDPCMIP